MGCEAILVAPRSATGRAAAELSSKRNALAVPAGIAACCIDVAHDGATRSILAPGVIVLFEAASDARTGPSAPGGDFADCIRQADAAGVPCRLAAGGICGANSTAACRISAASVSVNTEAISARGACACGRADRCCCKHAAGIPLCGATCRIYATHRACAIGVRASCGRVRRQAVFSADCDWEGWSAQNACFLRADRIPS